ncbi:1-(5-phosphoribosyl)-5-[(5-phosphoribosylamino)methylideneamino] imidazole-4-carboxamide isomerase [Hypnocyclicus thermotrophus]|uniref:1-(5-phosphoribosyl)-5-[(5-phosphoribosylamino)methylideneamino] imidazole-4-carboxamide isomerase n=1 Tax=Hypnocyclicus thermotrophus TaxID=1627895 RepID=A0AA46E0G7_9FUSO|nr:phosphoribosylformimino-5-aminoimidazole carboxamide ribotide isomerase [Hypnocyclicus thermotrophus]TDT72486.1 1-(5-phosphoribosyl)-5-[(5-phosphoribosylamino)methylideneamino] imidazole-4-carboxamide isomerase [Hypnocyclicus thermotrophus]
MFRPCIDLHNGKVKQIVGGTLSDNKTNSIIENFVSDKPASYYAKLFKKYNLTGGHVIKLGIGNDEEAISALKAFPNGLQIGGGITINNANLYIEYGASHVIVTSYVFNNGKIDFKRLENLSNLIGKDKLVLDLSCRKNNNKYYVVTDRWQNFTNFEISKENIKILENYCDEFLIHGVDVEGKKQGIDKELLYLINDYCSIPTTYAGGIRSLEDIKLINSIGNGKIHYTVGSALDIFGGNLSFEYIINNQNIK